MSTHFQGVESPATSPRKRPQSAKVAGKNATVTIPLAPNNAGGKDSHQQQQQPIISFAPRRPSDSGIPIPIPTGGRDSSLHQAKYQTQQFHHQQQNTTGNASRPLTSTSVVKNSAAAETPLTNPQTARQPGQQQIGGNRMPSRPTSAKTRWGEKRHTVKTSQEVMNEVAATIKDSEAKAMLAVGTNVKVCDQPGSGKFNTVFHLKGNHELQTEAHRTLMNTRFSAEDEERIVQDDPPSHEMLFRGGGTATSTSRPLSAKSRETGEGDIRSTSKARPQSAKSARSSKAEYSRPVTSVGGMTVSDSAAGRSSSGSRAAGRSISSVAGGGGSGLEGMMVQGSKVKDFQTFWHIQTNEQLRTDAMLNYSLGIHKEPFVPPADRVKFRNSKEEAKHPFEDAELRAETANANRPATPRSIMNFFGVNSERQYQDIDKDHDEEWRFRVMRKISEVDQRSKKPGEGKYFSLYRSQYYKHLKDENHNGSPRSQSPRTEEDGGRQLPFVVRGKGSNSRASKTPSSSAALKTDSRASHRQPLRGNNTVSSSTPDAPTSRTASRAAAKREAAAGGSSRGANAAAVDKTNSSSSSSSKIAHPKDVYAWNEQVVIPNPPQAASVSFRSQSAAH